MKYVPYFRVSTDKQGLNGLGMDAQQAAVAAFLQGNKPDFEFIEVESGGRNDRPQLEQAIACCKKHKAKLLIAKLDRLSRNAAFLLNLRDSGVDFVCCDCPNADKFTIGILALVAQRERELISERTKVALAAAKRRGIQLGNPQLAQAREAAATANQQQAQDFAATLAPAVAGIRKAGVTSLKGIAEALNRLGHKTARGKPFTALNVRCLLRHVDR